MKQPSKKLIQQWDKKLAKAGFEDAESRETGLLHRWDDMYYRRRYTEQTFAAKQRYYQLCTNFLNDGHFESELDKRVWTLHSEGLSRREIAKKVRKNFVTVHYIVVKYEQEAGIKPYDSTKTGKSKR